MHMLELMLIEIRLMSPKQQFMILALNAIAHDPEFAQPLGRHPQYMQDLPRTPISRRRLFCLLFSTYQFLDFLLNPTGKNA
jgi:hypothetical protein